MKWITALKFEYERQVLGLCMEVSPLALADILKPENFSDLEESRHALIYRIILSFQAGEPVNILTVSLRFKKEYGDNLWSSHYITGLNQGVYASDPRYYAMCLLELDIRSKVIQHLNAQMEYMTSKEQYEQSAIYKQCISLMEEQKNDLMEGMEICHRFIKKYIPEEAPVFERYIDSLPKVAERVKTLAKIQNACQQFESLCATIAEQESKEVAQKAKDIFILSLTAGKKPPQFFERLNKLHQTI